MATSTDNIREVLVRVKLQADPANVRELGNLSKGLRGAGQAGKQAGEDASKGIDKAAREAAKALKAAAAEHSRATGQIRAANEKMAESFKQGLSGAMSLGRGLAMLGLVGEKDTQKLLRALIRVQAVFDTLRGSVEIVQALTRGWQAYRTAVASAATAQATLAAAQAASLATGGAAAGKGGVGALGGAALGAGGAAAAGKVAGIGGLGMVGTFAAAAVGGAGGLTTAIETLYNVGRYGPGRGGPPGQLSTTIGGWEASLVDMLYGGRATGRAQFEGFRAGATGRMSALSAAREAASQRAALESQTWRRTASGRQWSAAELQGQLGQTRQQIGMYGELLGHTSNLGTPFAADVQGRLAGAKERELELIERVIQAKQREADEERRNYADRIRNHQSVLHALEAERKAHDALAEEWRLAGRGKQEAFGALETVQQHRLLGIRTRAQAGQQLTREEEALWAQYGGLEAEEQIAQLRRGRAATLGWQAGEGYEAKARAASTAARAVEVKIQQERDLVVKLETNDQALVARVTHETERLLKERDERLQRQLQEALDDLEHRLQREEFARNRELAAAQ